MDPSQLLKGVLDLAVLAALRDEDGYGYDILRRLRRAGLDDVGDASVYGTLRRLFQAGYLTSYVVPSEEGPHRKYYGPNAAGRAQLGTAGKVWHNFAATMDRLLGPGARRGPGPSASPVPSGPPYATPTATRAATAGPTR